MADLLKVKVPDKKDGISYLPALKGEEMKGHDYVIYSSMDGPAIVTKDGWKLRTYIKGNKENFMLYNLKKDYAEENELSKKYPEKVDTLKQILLKECNADLHNGIYYFERTPATELDQVKQEAERKKKTLSPEKNN
jgi:arylsulfatase A-like enzyme